MHDLAVVIVARDASNQNILALYDFATINYYTIKFLTALID